MKYAQINPETLQMVGVPRDLPERWISPDGVTITRFNKLSINTLKSLDWLPVIYGEKDQNSFYLNLPIYDEKNRQFFYEAVQHDIDVFLTHALQNIDMAASEACSRFIPHGVGQDARFITKHMQALRYLNDIDNIDNYPMIKREAELSKLSFIDMANLVIEKANIQINAMAEIEAIRCSMKRKCKKAENKDSIISLRNNAISQLEVL